MDRSEADVVAPIPWDKFFADVEEHFRTASNVRKATELPNDPGPILQGLPVEQENQQPVHPLARVETQIVLHEHVQEDALLPADDGQLQLGDDPNHFSPHQQTAFDVGRHEGFEQGHHQGLEEGRQHGLEEGRQQGLAEGYQTGRGEGYQNGFAEGKTEGLKDGRAAKHRDMCDTLKDITITRGTPPPDEVGSWIIRAINRNKLQSVNLLLDLNANPLEDSASDSCPNGGDLAICVAARKGYVDIVKALIDHGVSVDARNGVGDTALLAAAAAGKQDVVRILIDTHHADKNAQRHGPEMTGYTPLMMAVFYGRMTTAETLLRRDVDGSIRSPEDEHVLHVAAKRDHQGMVAWVVRNYQGVALKDAFGNSPLHYAAENGSQNGARYLIENGPALVEVKNNKGQAPLHLAAQGKHAEIVTMLLNQAEPDSQDNAGETALHYAIGSKSPAVVGILLHKNAQADKVNHEGVRAIEQAMALPPEEETSTAILGEFLQMHQTGQELYPTFTVLSKAIENGQLYIVEKITADRPELINVVPKDSGSKPAIHQAIISGKLRILRHLCGCEGTNMDLVDKDKNGVLHQAVISRKSTYVSVLVEAGAKPDEALEHPKGFAPLHLAAELQELATAKALVQQNATVKKRISKGIAGYDPCSSCREHRGWSGTVSPGCILLRRRTPRGNGFEELRKLLRHDTRR
jgi:ankyrin repeat protein